MAKMVERDTRLQFGINTKTTPNEYNVRFHAEDGGIYIRQTDGNADMRTYADAIAEASVSNQLVREDWQKKLIKWATENVPGSVYYISFELYSEPNMSGNMSRYYYINRRGADGLTYGGTALKKIFTSRAAAIKAAYYVYNYFSKHQRERGERKQLKVTLHKQYLLKPSEEILTLYEGKIINGEPLK